MKRAALLMITFALASVVDAGDWTMTNWNGEPSYFCDAGEWRAVVSVERGRLVYFGASDGAHNLLFAPATREEPVGWGGHRVWLGPQSEWGWPPPKAWEASAAEKVTIRDGEIELLLPDAGSGWPRVTRVYFWRDGALHCDVRLRGGTRPAQIIQILQTPVATVPALRPHPTTRARHGYVQVHGGRTPSPRFDFPVPPHIVTSGDLVRLKFIDATEKLAFEPQPIAATNGEVQWQMARGASEGRALSVPDEGYATQVFLGSGKDHLIELEQLSPLWAAAGDAHFEIVLHVTPGVGD